MDLHPQRATSSVLRRAPRSHRLRGSFALLILLLALVAGGGSAPAVAAGSCGSQAASVIACENALPGDPASDWQITGSGDQTIQGFAIDMSVNLGGTVHFKVSTPATSYHIDILRMGYYGGAGARKIASGLRPTASLPQAQPACLSDATTGLVDCGNWAESASWAVPATAVSGIYFAHLVRDDTGGSSHIYFVVRNDASTSNIVYMTSDTTWQAYNRYGGNDFYVGSPAPPVYGAGRAYKVSYNRPIIDRDCCAEDFVFYAEYPMVRFMEANGYDVSYLSGVDVERSGSLLKNHKVFMDAGHDEYWSGGMRNSVLAARDAGVNLAFFSGNLMYWKTRFEPSIDGSGTATRTLVCYKETWSNAVIDPQDPPTWTGTWADPRFSPPGDGGRPSNALVGSTWTVNTGTANLQVPYADAALRLWRNTAVAALTPGQTATLAPGTVGYEWDSDLDNGSRPPGLIDMSSTTVAVPQMNLDYGQTVGPGTATNSLTLYRAPSGALVFSAGSVQWAWGLDDTHDDILNGVNAHSTDPSMQQAMINLFADMHVQPATLIAGLVAATASADTTPPSATVTSPSAGSGVVVNQPVTVTGTAVDGGGGVVAGVEVSTDGGATWHPAQGHGSWSYTWVPSTTGTASIRARATDDSGNLGAASAAVGVSVTSVCPCTIFGSTATPTTAFSADPAPVEVGVRFQSSLPGTVSGIRFYKGAGNSGAHVGDLWTSSGQLLATATFGAETASGWQQVTFGTPVTVSANTTYVASYHTTAGYATSLEYFATTGATAGPLTAPGGPAGSGANGSNGVFGYGSGSTFPTTSFEAANYWVDVVWSPNNAPYVSSTSPASGAIGVSPSIAVTATFGTPIDATTLAFGLQDPSATSVGATVSYNTSTRTATLHPSAALTQGTSYTATVSAKDAGGTSTGPVTWSFTTSGVRPCPCSIWTASATPAVISAADNGPLELGVKFRSDVSGYVYGIRFYKGAGNTGTHVGNLWTSTGTNLASAAFTAESASGWQQVGFATPVAITANTTYIASYFAPAGHYADSAGYFTPAGADYAPLHALKSGVDGVNGLYQYGPTSVFPSSSFQGANYWVDVVFSTQADTAAPSVTTVSPTPGATGVPIAAPVTATFSKAVQAPSVAVTLTDSHGAAVAGTTGYTAPTLTATFTPAQALAGGASYTAAARATGANGVAMAAPFSWSFTTVAYTCPCSIWSASAVPAVTDAGPDPAVELGVRFRTDAGGYITGVRFYKSAANTGTHIGNLWSAGGTLLASATFSGETASGWQQVSFPGPVPVTAGATYVASYLAPAGHYSVTSGQFSAAGVDTPPLHALQDLTGGGDGVFQYGSTSTFPTSSYHSTNYWVDVVFATQGSAYTTPPSVTAKTPASGATGVSTSVTPTATFSEAVQPSSISFLLKDAGGNALTRLVTYDQASHAVTMTPGATLVPGSTYTLSLSATDLYGNAMAAPVTWSFTMLAPPSCPCTIWSSATVPPVPDSGDGSAVELGVQFRSDLPGQITGIAFYKSAANTGTHVGNLWSAAGTLLATATFSGETASGWQQVSFSTPVTIAANTTYVASYWAPAGHYSAAGGAFSAAGVDSPPLHALANGAAGGNGLYRYGSDAFPSSSYNSTNYFVDVVFHP